MNHSSPTTPLPEQLVARIPQHRVRWAFVALFWGAAILLLSGSSDTTWHLERSFRVVLGRYSTERFGLALFFFLAGLAPLLAWVHSVTGTWNRRVLNVAETGLVLAYSLAALWACSEYFFHHNPRQIFGGTALNESWQFILVGQSEMIPDPDLGRRGPPNVVAPCSHATLYNIRHLYDPATWDVTPDPRVDYTSDAAGFRNPVAEGPVDLLVVGDSFTHAPLVERDQIWSSLLARAEGWSERNLGVSGYGPPQAAIVLDRYAGEFDPRLVLMQIYLGNDIFDALEFELWKRSGKSYRLFTREHYQLPLIVPTFEWLRGTVFSISRLPADRPERKPLAANSIRVGTQTIKVGFEPSVHLLTKTKEEFTTHPGMTPLLDGISAASQACQRMGVPFGIVIVPIKLRILFEAFETERDREEALLAQRPRPEVESPQALVELVRSRQDNQNLVIREFLEQEKIPYLDLTESLFQAVGTEGLLPYFPMDSHWNDTGHVVAAKAIREWRASVPELTLRPAPPSPPATP